MSPLARNVQKIIDSISKLVDSSKQVKTLSPVDLLDFIIMVQRTLDSSLAISEQLATDAQTWRQSDEEWLQAGGGLSNGFIAHCLNTLLQQYQYEILSDKGLSLLVSATQKLEPE